MSKNIRRRQIGPITFPQFSNYFFPRHILMVAVELQKIMNAIKYKERKIVVCVVNLDWVYTL